MLVTDAEQFEAYRGHFFANSNGFVHYTCRSDAYIDRPNWPFCATMTDAYPLRMHANMWVEIKLRQHARNPLVDRSPSPIDDGFEELHVLKDGPRQ